MITSAMARFSTLLAGASLLGAVFAFPPTPQNITVVKSKFGSNITISFKEVRTRHLEDVDT